MSPRVVNSHYDGSKHRDLLKSPGFAFDREHAAAIWEPSEDGPVTVHQLALAPYVAGYWKERPWGWEADDEIWDKPKFKKSKQRWKISGERCNRLESMIKLLGKKGVRMLLYLSPVHPVIRKSSHVDDDGTTREGYRDLVRRLKALERQYPNLFFVDLLQGGEHDFGTELFVDLDHLNESGAAKLARMLEAIRRRHE